MFFGRKIPFSLFTSFWRTFSRIFLNGSKKKLSTPRKFSQQFNPNNDKKKEFLTGLESLNENQIEKKFSN